MSSPVIKLKRGAYSDLPTLAIGEPGFTTDRYQLFVGSPDGNKLIGGGEFWNLNSTTVGGGIKVYEATNNGTNSIELRSPNSLSGDIVYVLPGSDGSADQVLKTDGSGNLTFASVNSLSNAGLNNIVEDTTPQLGGNLDLNNKVINGTGTINYTGNLTASGNASFVAGAAVINGSGASISGIVTATTFSGPLPTTDLTGTITNDQLAGSIVDSKLNQIVTANKVAISAIDIDGATDIGEAIIDSDEFIIDNGGNGTNRKTDASRIKTYILGGASGATFSSVVVGSAVTINSSGIDVTGVVTATTFKGNLVGDVTGNADTATGVDVTDSSTVNTAYNVVLTEGSGPGETMNMDTGLTYNPFTNTLVSSKVTGDLTGNVTGNVTGNTTGTHNGAVVGNVTGNLTGDVTGDVTGNVTGNLTGNVTGDVTGDLTGQADGADQVKTQSSSTNSNHYLTFVDSNNGSATNESLKTDAGVYYNPFTNQFNANGVNAGVLSLNSVDVTSTATELNYLDGSTPGSATASNAVVLDGSRNITNINSLTASSLNGPLTGNVTGNVAGNLTGNVTAGVVTASSAVVNGNITVTGTVDGRDVLDDGQAGDNLVTLSGVARDATDLGTFTGSTVGDAETIKGAIQDLETSLETVAGGGALAASVAVGATDNNSTHFLSFVADNNTDPTQEQLKTDGDLNYNPSTNTLTATNISGELTGNVTGNVTGNLTGNVTGDVTGNATSSDTVDVSDSSSTNATFYPVFSSGSGAAKTINRDTGLTFNPSQNKLTTTTFVGALTGNASSSDEVKTQRVNTNSFHYLTFVDGDNTSASNENLNTSLLATFNPATGDLVANKLTASSNFFLGGTEVTSTAAELNVLDGVTSFLDEDNMSSNSSTSIPSQQSVKAYVDTEVAGVAVTFTLAADSGTSDIFQTGQTLTISGTSEEIDTTVTDNTITISLPDDVVVGTSLSSPTIQGTTFKAVDGTTAFTVANSTGKVTTSADLEVQGSSTVQGFTVQGNTQIGDQTSDTVGFTARLSSDLIPTADGIRNLGSSAIRYKEVFSDSVTGSNFTAGIITATTYNGTTMTLTGGGNFGGNVDIAGNLSVGGSITSINVDDFRSVSPLIEVGLEDLGDGSFQPPSFATQYSTGIAMWYNTVGINSTNAQAASIFASVKPGGSFRIGFATDVSFAGSGTTDGVGVVNAWADIEAKGLWINDCAGQSEVISCSGGVRNLSNITIDAGAFS